MQRTRLQSVSSSPGAVCVGATAVGVLVAPRPSEREGRTVCRWARLPKADSQGVTVVLERVTT
ncbi:hypothetical protein [Streptomyces sp. D2-8]|uniref:hypothetical protein n=1 Tax=Streptomyces sp. D2-8 TaxID=2707767 RepID=UPI0020BE82AD|nr:hypothetical protein [Streptomyces sp. D2-8]